MLDDDGPVGYRTLEAYSGTSHLFTNLLFADKGVQGTSI